MQTLSVMLMKKAAICSKKLKEVTEMAINPKKQEMPTQAPEVRAHNFSEVALGYTKEMAMGEAERCLNCKNQPCVAGCPVNINIPDFITYIKQGDFEARSASEHHAQ